MRGKKLDLEAERAIVAETVTKARAQLFARATVDLDVIAFRKLETMVAETMRDGARRLAYLRKLEKARKR